MPTVDRVSEVVSRLEEMILSKQLAPGDLLPPEREIGTQLSVSRSVVREALGRLESVGLISSQQGSGTRVAAPSGKQLSQGYGWLMRHGRCSLHDLSVVRLPLETTIASLAAQHRTEEQLAQLDETQQFLGNSRRTLKSHVEADLRFHAILAEATRNPLFQILLTPIQELLIESRRLTLGRYGVELAFNHHARILEAVRDRQPDEAERAMADHLRVNIEQLAGESELPHDS
jgi:GntR family transcriptional repressor for pyruvate dehydrogenase complex